MSECDSDLSLCCCRPGAGHEHKLTAVANASSHSPFLYFHSASVQVRADIGCPPPSGSGDLADSGDLTPAFV